MSRTFKGLVSLALAAVLLAGCGSGTGSSQTTADTEAAGSSAAVTTSAETASASEETASSSAEESAGSTTAGTETESETASAGSVSAAEGSGKVLVVYYSATGNTRAVAEVIAEAAGADIFEITPVEPYTDDDLNYNSDDSRVVKEHEDESLQNQVELTTTEVENWDSYDTVFFGYPIWWGIAAWPVNQFVQNNDFTGKTVIPFCTSASSGLGESGNNLAEMAGTGDWQEGQRFSSHADEADVTSWVQDVIGQ